jgi:uncharacterized protein Yka (UPF0111/DUF47 family)
MTDREQCIKEGMDKINKIIKLDLEQFNIVEGVLFDLYDIGNTMKMSESETDQIYENGYKDGYQNGYDRALVEKY